MSIKNLYYFLDDGTYVEGYEGDNIYNEKTCTLIPKKPAQEYVWDSLSEQWIVTVQSKSKFIRGIRNLELCRTDKYMISDYPISEDDKEQVIIYRQKLRDVTDKQTPEEIVMPTCPEVLELSS